MNLKAHGCDHDKVPIASVMRTCIGGGKIAHRGRDIGTWHAEDVEIFSVI